MGERKFGAGSPYPGSGLEMSYHGNRASEVTLPLLSEQSGDSTVASTGTAKEPMYSTLSTARAPSMDNEDQEANESKLREATDDRERKEHKLQSDGNSELLTEHYNNAHPRFWIERGETYRELGDNRYPTQTIMTTVVDARSPLREFRKLRHEDAQWLFKPLHIYSYYTKPRKEDTTNCDRQCYYLKMMPFSVGYGILLIPLFLFACAFSCFRIFCGVAHTKGERESCDSPNPTSTGRIRSVARKNPQR
jgi:hypothetical protein